jgi:hypothetical protein
VSENQIIESEIDAVFEFESSVRLNGKASTLGTLPEGFTTQATSVDWRCSFVSETIHLYAWEDRDLKLKEVFLETSFQREGFVHLHDIKRSLCRLYDSQLINQSASKLPSWNAEHKTYPVGEEGYEGLINRVLTDDLVESLPRDAGEWIFQMKEGALREIKAGTYLQSVHPPGEYAIIPTGNPLRSAEAPGSFDHDVFMVILEQFARRFLWPFSLCNRRYAMHADELEVSFEIRAQKLFIDGPGDMPSERLLGHDRNYLPLDGSKSRAIQVDVTEKSKRYYLVMLNRLIEQGEARAHAMARFDRSLVPGAVRIIEWKSAWWIWSDDYDQLDGPFDSLEGAESQFWPTGITSALTEVVTHEESFELALAKLNLYFDKSWSDEDVEFTLTLGGVDGDANAKRQLSEVAVVDQSTEDGRQLVIKRAS